MKRHEAIAALFDAAKVGDLGGVRAALAEGIGPDAAAKGRKTALIHAIERNKLPVVHYLHSCGADVNCATAEGRRPLHYAAGRERVEMVRFLLSVGADPTLRDQRGNAPERYVPWIWASPKAKAIRAMLLNPADAESVVVEKPPRKKRAPKREPILRRMANAVRLLFTRK